MDELELPNALWLRSPKMPHWAICLDPDNPHFGWKFQAGYPDQWVSMKALTIDEATKMLTMFSCQSHRDQIGTLVDRLLAAVGASEGGA